MRSLTESIVAGASLPGPDSGTVRSLLEDEGNENMATRLADSFAQAINRTAGGTGVTGDGPLCDTNYKRPSRMSFPRRL